MVNCGNKFLQDMLVPRRLRAALTEIDADGSGEIDKPEWEIAIQAALEKKLAELEAERAAQREADRLADEAFTKEFLAAAMEVFRLLDTDESMSLDHDEFVGGVAHNPMVCSRRPGVLWCFHFLGWTRVHLTSTRVVSLSNLSEVRDRDSIHITHRSRTF